MSLLLLFQGGGSAPITGQVSQALGALTSSSAATLEIKGQLSVTLGALATVSASTLEISGQQGGALGELAVLSTAQVEIKGQGSVTLGELTLSSTATIASAGGITGQVNATLGELTCVSTANMPLVAGEESSGGIFRYARKVVYTHVKAVTAIVETVKRRITWRSGSKQVFPVAVTFDQPTVALVYKASALQVKRFAAQPEQQYGRAVWGGVELVAAAPSPVVIAAPRLSTVASRALLVDMRRLDAEMRSMSVQVIPATWHTEAVLTGSVFLSSYEEGFTDELAFVLALID